MTSERELSLEVLERQLDRTHQFFPRIDVKLSTLFAITSGQIAVSAVNLSPGDLKCWWIVVPLVVFLLTAAWIMLNLYNCAYPHLKGGHKSLLYFNEIAKLREVEYIKKVLDVSEEEYFSDVAGQIWRNSEIVCLKYKYLKFATISSMLSLIPWLLLLLSVSVTNGHIPEFGS